MKSVTNVRPVERLDTKRILELEPKWTEQDLIDFVSESRTRLYVIEEGDGNVVGFLAFSAQEEFESEIVKLIIDKDYHNQGFEENLFSKAKRLAKAANTETLIVHSPDSDTYMHLFYKSKNPKDKPKIVKDTYLFSFAV